MPEPFSPTSDSLQGNVRQTLATALKVLAHLEQSLCRAGFAEGREAYRKMADTVVGQCLWLNSAGCEVPSELAQIAERARAVHALLNPYADAMLRLGALCDALPGKPAAEPPPEPPDPVLDLLSQARRPLSLTALRAELGGDRKQLLARLEALEQSGRITRRNAGGRETFGLAESP